MRIGPDGPLERFNGSLEDRLLSINFMFVSRKSAEHNSIPKEKTLTDSRKLLGNDVQSGTLRSLS